jgi:O-antigen/teichoic acid export membrane protein
MQCTKLKEKIKHLILSSERYTKTDMRYILKNASYFFWKKGFLAVVSLISSMILARTISQSMFGQYKFLVSVVDVLALATLAGMESSLLIAASKKFSVHHLKTMIHTRMYFGLAGSAVAITGSIYYGIAGDITLMLGLLLGAIAIPLFDPYGSFVSILSGIKDFRTQSIYATYKNTLPIVAVFLSSFFIKQGLILFIIFFAVAIITRSVLLQKTVDRYRKKLSDATNTSIEKTKELISYGKFLTVVSLLPRISIYVDKLVIFPTLGAKELAIFLFASIPIDQLKSLFDIIVSIAKPKFAESADPKEQNKKFLYKYILLLVVTIVGIGVYILIAPYAFALLFPQYQEAVIYSQIMALSLISGPSKLIVALLEMRGYKKHLLGYNMLNGSIGITITVGLTLLYGLWGAAIAKVATRIFASIISVAQLQYIIYKQR